MDANGDLSHEREDAFRVWHHFAPCHTSQFASTYRFLSLDDAVDDCSGLREGHATVNLSSFTRSSAIFPYHIDPVGRMRQRVSALTECL